MGEKGPSGFVSQTDAPVQSVEEVPHPTEGENGLRPEFTETPEGGERGLPPLG